MDQFDPPPMRVVARRNNIDRILTVEMIESGQYDRWLSDTGKLILGLDVGTDITNDDSACWQSFVEVTDAIDAIDQPSDKQQDHHAVLDRYGITVELYHLN